MKWGSEGLENQQRTDSGLRDWAFGNSYWADGSTRGYYSSPMGDGETSCFAEK